MNRKELERIFQNILSENSEWPMVLGVVRQCIAGKVWLVGEYLYRNLAGHLHGMPVLKTDYDFATELLRPMPDLPGWTVTQTSGGSPRLQKDGVQIEIVQLSNSVTMKRRGLAPTMENYLTGAPLTIQSIAYDLDSGALLGEAGIRSILTKRVSPLDREKLRARASLYKITVDTYMSQKLPQGFVFVP